MRDIDKASVASKMPTPKCTTRRHSALLGMTMGLSLGLSLSLSSGPNINPSLDLTSGLVSVAHAQKKAAPAAGKDAKKSVSFDRDEQELTNFRADKERALSKSRLKRIAYLERIIKTTRNKAEKADLLFRLAELEWDEAKYRYFLRRKQYEKEYQAYLDKTLSRRPEEPVPDYSNAERHYKTILEHHNNYRKLDVVYFYLGRSYKLANNNSKMLSVITQLKEKFCPPKDGRLPSDYCTQAHLMLAEMFFEKNLMVAAKPYYLKVIEDSKAPEYPYGLYKLGFTNYNLQEYDDSIKIFKQVIELGLSGKRKVSFQRQAYNTLAQAFAEVEGGWQKARDYFRSIEERAKESELMMRKLEVIGSIFNQQGKNEKMFEVYEYLISEAPMSFRVPEYADTMIKVYQKEYPLEKSEEQVMRFFEYFAPDSSWESANQGKSDDEASALTRAGQFRATQLDWLISSFHTKAQKLEEESRKLSKPEFAEKSVTYYEKAAKYYALFIDTFPKAKDLYDKEFFLAEILSYQRGKWDDAITRYTSVLKRNPKGEHSKDAAYKVILCSEEKMGVAGLITPPDHFKESGKISTKATQASIEYTKKSDEKDFKPAPKKKLHETALAFLEACKNYTGFYPEDSEVPSLSFRSAEIFIRAGHYAEGIKRLETIMTYHGNHEFASYAAATLFDANYRLRRWDQMERWGRYMMKKRNFKVLSKKQLENVIAISIIEYATELSQKGTKFKKEGNPVEGQDLQDKAIKQIMRFLKEFPKHKEAATALANAAYMTELAERTPEAVKLYERLIKEYKKSPRATEAHFVLGALYESQTRFDLAATYFERMASFPNIKDMKKVKSSLYNAGSIRLALKEYKSATKIFEQYVKKFPEDENTPELYLQLANTYRTIKNWRAERKVYNRYIKKYKSSKPGTIVEAHLLIAESHLEENTRKARKLVSAELEKALKAYGSLSKKQQQDKKVNFSAARSRFLQAEYELQDFIAYQIIPHPQRKLKKTLEEKAKQQQACEKSYFEVLKFKAFQVSAGAFYRIAFMYYNFTETLLKLEPPRVLQDNPDMLMMYESMIEETVIPLEEKAKASAEQALNLAHNKKVYNEWSKRSAVLLAKLAPQLFPILDDRVVNTDQQVPATFSTQYISDPAGRLGEMIRAAQAKQATKEKKAESDKPTATQEAVKEGEAAGESKAPAVSKVSDKADKEAEQ